MSAHLATVNGIRLHYLDHAAAGAPIVLLPGLSANAHVFDGLIAAGLASKHRVIAMTLRGRGESSAPESGYRMADHAADVLALLDELELARVVMAGHSFGSLLALYIAAHHPERVERLVMLDGSLLADESVRAVIQPSIDRLSRIMPSAESYLDAIRRAPYWASEWDSRVEGYYRAEIDTLSDGRVRSRTKAHAIAKALDGLFAEPWETLAREVNCPSLVVNAIEPFGGQGALPVVPRRSALASAARLDRSRYVEVGGNHLTMLFGDHAPAVVREMTSFLASDAQATGRIVSSVARTDAGARRYELFVPPGGEDAPRPLVVMLHGCTQSAADIARGTRMSAIAASRGWMALYPEQPTHANQLRCWNWFLPQHRERDAGEASILGAMIREVIELHGADASRIYVAGMSAGAAMASVLAVAYPELVSALALHSGVPWGAASTVVDGLALMSRAECDAAMLGARAREVMGDGARPIPTFVLHGASDAVVHRRNGEQTAAMWVAANARGAATKIEERSRTENGRAVDARTWRDAQGRTLVEQWEIAELGHAWSGGDTAGSYVDALGPDASAHIADFFVRTTMEWSAAR